MDNRRFVTFLVFFFAFTWIYTNLILPKLFPPLPQPVAQNVDAGVGKGEATKGETNAAGAVSKDGENGSDQEAAANDAGDASQKPAAAEPPVHPRKRAVLGSADTAEPYFIEVQLGSAGAAIESVRLADPKFRDLRNQDEQVQVVGNNLTEDRTFSLAIDAIDRQLEKFDLNSESIDWELTSATPDEAVFALEAPDHSVRVEKTYRVHRVDVAPEEKADAYLTNAAGFTLELDVRVINLSQDEQSVSYELQGPVGVILENVDHTRKYQDIKIEFLDDTEDDVTLSASKIEDLYKKQRKTAIAAGSTPDDRQLRQMIRQSEPWTGAFRYAGVDVQFFAALLAPLDERPLDQRLVNKWIDRAYPVLIYRDSVNVEQSEISFRMASAPISLGTTEDNRVVTHRFAFFVGPKRSELLDQEPMRADRVLDYGSWFGLIARGMHYLLDTFYHVGMPYALAIICLTIVVRGALFPLSRKQAISAARMKDLQPRLNEIKLKYADDKQKQAQAQMELWRKHNINPLGGCLPLFIQMPIFIALYTCLNTAVDLRLARFLWIDNLAAPDALFQMPFSLPFFGRDFSILPCITVGLFFLQQKMFMPPAASEEQEAQYKMMNMMTLMFGVFFWHTAAGLCLYFIASSLWGIAERKLLGGTGSTAAGTEPSVVVREPSTVTPAGKGGRGGNGKPVGNAPKKTGFLARLMEAAEEAQRQAERNREQQEKASRGRGKNRR
ncbi:MAG: membrane protein insertase YidC [Planctomycetaceae bacterium]|nr:membrane protein insertase YidC [Planctomycetaceae bacterium]